MRLKIHQAHAESLLYRLPYSFSVLRVSQLSWKVSLANFTKAGSSDKMKFVSMVPSSLSVKVPNKTGILPLLVLNAKNTEAFVLRKLEIWHPTLSKSTNPFESVGLFFAKKECHFGIVMKEEIALEIHIINGIHGCPCIATPNFNGKFDNIPCFSTFK